MYSDDDYYDDEYSGYGHTGAWGVFFRIRLKNLSKNLIHFIRLSIDYSEEKREGFSIF